MAMQQGTINSHSHFNISKAREAEANGIVITEAAVAQGTLNASNLRAQAYMRKWTS